MRGVEKSSGEWWEYWGFDLRNPPGNLEVTDSKPTFTGLLTASGDRLYRRNAFGFCSSDSYVIEK